MNFLGSFVSMTCLGFKLRIIFGHIKVSDIELMTDLSIRTKPISYDYIIITVDWW